MDRVGIVGAGFMGSGIAEAAAHAGIDVVVHEPHAEPLARSRERIAGSLDRAAARGTIEATEVAGALRRVSHSTELGDLRGCELVVEAVTEDERIKIDVFRRLDELVPADVILASNTSSIPIANLAGATARPHLVLGLHFFSPVPVMKLVEVVPALPTSLDAIAAAEALVRQLGKHPIRAKDRAGFLVNALLIPYLVAAIRRYDDGLATREDIDDGMKLGCGHPMGPLTLCDFIGLDVIDGICTSLYEEYKREEYASPPLLKRMVAAGCLGRKNGKGFYDYAAIGIRAAAA